MLDHQGRGLRGARLELRPEKRRAAPQRTLSGAGGYFLFDGAPAGRYRLVVSAAGAAAFERGVRLPRRLLRVRLRRVYRLDGRIAAEGGPVAGIEVVLVASTGRQRNMLSDERGGFAFEGLTAGLYELAARSTAAPWRASPVTTRFVPARRGAAQDETPLVLKLEAATRLGGKVMKGEAKEPLAQAYVSLRPLVPTLFDVRAQSDAQGRFLLPALPAGRYRLQAWAAGRLPQLGRTVTLPAQRLDLRLSRGHVLVGVVLSETGTPIAAAVVRAIVDDSVAARRRARAGAIVGSRTIGELGVVPGPLPPIPSAEGGAVVPAAGSLQLWSVASDNKGAFALSGLPAGRVRLFVSHPRYQQLQGPWLTLGGGSVASQRIVLRRGTELRGVVKDARQVPIAHARVVAEEGGGRRSTYTDGRGRFRFFGLGQAPTLSVRAKGFGELVRTVHLQPGKPQDVELVLELAGGSLHGRVVDERRLPVPGAQLSARGSFGRRQAESDGRGEFRLSGLRFPLQLRVRHRRYVGLSRRLQRADAFAPLELQLAPLGMLRGRIQSFRTGVAVRRFSLRLDGGKPRAYSDRSGHFELGAAPGKHRLEVSAAGFSKRVLSVSVADPSGTVSPHDKRIDLHEAGQIEGLVRDQLGRPVVGARVESGGVSARSDRQGRFRLNGVAEGSHVVTLTIASKSWRSDPVAVRAGETAGPVRFEVQP